MMALKICLLVFFGVAAGALTSAGYFAVITGVGLINRVAAVTKTTNKIIVYEEMLIWGGTIGNILAVFDISGIIPKHLIDTASEDALHIAVTWIAVMVIVIYGVFAGVFTGLLVVCLAETTKALPIFIRRVRIGAGLGIIMLMIGLGKAVGHLLFYLVF